MKSETSDSFVSHFDGHFAYFRTLEFFFKKYKEGKNKREKKREWHNAADILWKNEMSSTFVIID